MNTGIQSRIDENNEKMKLLIADNAKLEAEKNKVHSLSIDICCGKFVASGCGEAMHTELIYLSQKVCFQGQGRIFATKQECEKFIAREAAIVRINRAILFVNGDGVPDWSDATSNKFSPYFDHENLRWLICDRTYCQQDFTLIACYSYGALKKIIAEHAANFALVIGGE